MTQVLESGLDPTSLYDERARSVSKSCFNIFHNMYIPFEFNSTLYCMLQYCTLSPTHVFLAHVFLGLLPEYEAHVYRLAQILPPFRLLNTGVSVQHHYICFFLSYLGTAWVSAMKKVIFSGKIKSQFRIDCNLRHGCFWGPVTLTYKN